MRFPHARSILRVGTILLVLPLTACGSGEQDDHTQQMESGGASGEFAFVGTVQGVDTTALTVTVLNEDVPGWMGPMTLAYHVDEPEVVKTLKAGDRITARVHGGDFGTLYGVAVPPQ